MLCEGPLLQLTTKALQTSDRSIRGRIGFIAAASSLKRVGIKKSCSPFPNFFERDDLASHRGVLRCGRIEFHGIP